MSNLNRFLFFGLALVLVATGFVVVQGTSPAIAKVPTGVEITVDASKKGQAYQFFAGGGGNQGCLWVDGDEGGTELGARVRVGRCRDGYNPKYRRQAFIFQRATSKTFRIVNDGDKCATSSQDGPYTRLSMQRCGGANQEFRFVEWGQRESDMVQLQEVKSQLCIYSPTWEMDNETRDARLEQCGEGVNDEYYDRVHWTMLEADYITWKGSMFPDVDVLPTPLGVKYSLAPKTTARVTQIVGPGGGCLDVEKPRPGKVTRVGVATCAKVARQRFGLQWTDWNLGRFRIVNGGTRCVAAKNGYLITQPCGGRGEDFGWYSYSTKRNRAVIRNKDAGKCLVNSTIVKQGYPIPLQSCRKLGSGSEVVRQTWRMTDRNYVRWGQPVTDAPNPGYPAPPPDPDWPSVDPVRNPTSWTMVCRDGRRTWQLYTNEDIPAGSDWGMSVSQPDGGNLKLTSDRPTYISSTTGTRNNVSVTANRTIPAGTNIFLTPSYYWIPNSSIGPANSLNAYGYGGDEQSISVSTSHLPCG